jgi:hypothetical protein
LAFPRNFPRRRALRVSEVLLSRPLSLEPMRLEGSWRSRLWEVSAAQQGLTAGLLATSLLICISRNDGLWLVGGERRSVGPGRYCHCSPRHRMPYPKKTGTTAALGCVSFLERAGGQVGQCLTDVARRWDLSTPQDETTAERNEGWEAWRANLPGPTAV